jgi:hypothetical protein
MFVIGRYFRFPRLRAHSAVQINLYCVSLFNSGPRTLIILISHRYSGRIIAQELLSILYSLFSFYIYNLTGNIDGL